MLYGSLPYVLLNDETKHQDVYYIQTTEDLCIGPIDQTDSTDNSHRRHSIIYKQYVTSPKLRSYTNDRKGSSHAIISHGVVRATRQVNGRRQTYPSHHTHTP